MTSDNDVMTTLAKLRPTTAVETSLREASLERVLAVAHRPPVVRRRRALIGTVLAAVLVPAAVGAAAAGGVLPRSFTEQLSFWSYETKGEVDADNARRAAQMPGPDGSVLSFWTATGQDGTRCLSLLLEAPGELTRPAPASFDPGAGTCLPTSAPAGTFGDVSGSVTAQHIHLMFGSAGDAARAELRLTDGSVRPVALAEGQFFYWYLADRQVDSPTLVGYDAAGREVGTRRLPNLVAQTHLGG
jgi:hypothetical protein